VRSDLPGGHFKNSVLSCGYLHTHARHTPMTRMDRRLQCGTFHAWIRATRTVRVPTITPGCTVAVQAQDGSEEEAVVERIVANDGFAFTSTMRVWYDGSEWRITDVCKQMEPEMLILRKDGSLEDVYVEKSNITLMDAATDDDVAVHARCVSDGTAHTLPASQLKPWAAPASLREGEQEAAAAHSSTSKRKRMVDEEGEGATHDEP